VAGTRFASAPDRRQSAGDYGSTPNTSPGLRIEKPGVGEGLPVWLACPAGLERDRRARHRLDDDWRLAWLSVHHHFRAVVRVADILDRRIHPRCEVVLNGR